MMPKVLLLTLLLIGVPISFTHSATLISCSTSPDTPPPPKPGSRG